MNENDIGYVFPGGEDIAIKNGTVSGAWSDIGLSSGVDTTVYEGETFTLSIPHGNLPKDDGYSYIVLPEADVERTAEYAANNPIRIIENTSSMQAVYHTGVNIGYAVFYKAGECRFTDECVIMTDKLCVAMVRKTETGYKVGISNPEQKKENITVNLNGKTQIFEMKGTELGGSEMGGSTIIKEF